MSERTLTFRVRLRDDGTVAGIEKIDKELGKLGHGIDDLNRKNRGLAGTFGEIERRVGGVRTALLAFLAVGGTAGYVVKQGVDFNAQLEMSERSLAALINQFAEIRDSQGRLLEGSEKLTAAQKVAVEMQEQLKLESLATTAEFEELLRVVQTGLGPALQASFDPKQVVEFTRMVAQAGGVLGIRAEELPQEIRALLMGEKGPDNRLANALLGDIDDAKKKIRELADEGKLFEWFEERMEGITAASGDLDKTFTGAMSNLKDAVRQALGEATQDPTSQFTQLLNDLKEQIVTIDEEGKATFNEDFVRSIEAVAGAFVSLGGAAVEGLETINGLIERWETYKELVARRHDFDFSVEWDDVVKERAAKKKIDERYELDQRYRTGEYHLMDRGIVGRDGRLSNRNLELEQFISDEGGGRLARMQDVFTATADLEKRGEQELDRYLVALKKFSADGVLTLNEFREAKKAALSSGFTATGNPRAPEPDKKAQKARERLEAIKESYFEWDDDFRRQLEGRGDPLAEALAGNEAKRDKALDQLAKFKETLGKLLDPDDAKDSEARINAYFDAEAIEIATKSLQEFNNKILSGVKFASEMRAELESLYSESAFEDQMASLQRAVEDGRLDEVEASIEREYMMRVQANEQTFDALMAQIEEEYGADETLAEHKRKLIAELTKFRATQDKKATDHYQRELRKQIVGTAEWAEKMKATHRSMYGSMRQDIEQLSTATVDAFGNGITSFLNDLRDGQVDVGDTLRDVADDISGTWNQTMSNMVMRALTGGESIKAQFKQIGDAMRKDLGSAIGGGVGIGSMVGGLGSALMGPNNYASEGGLAGGIVGAIIGAYFGAPQAGAYIGAAIGTAIGGLISKGEDSIRIAIEDGVVTGTEKGISKEGMTRLIRDVQRKVKGVTKEWNSIVDLFPEEMQSELDKFVFPINSRYSMEDADIKDETAFQAISDFFAEKLPQSAFRAYSHAVVRGLELLGVSSERIEQQFKFWGELQGKELQGAVRAYIETFLETGDLQELFSGDILGAARKDAQRTVFDNIDTFTSDLSKMVESLKGLDAEDQITAQQEINRLTKEHYAYVIRALQEIDAMEKASMQSIAGMREQIQLAGMDDQGKMDFFYDRMWALRQQLDTATDPVEIQRLLAEIQNYGQQAFSLAPENAENRDKLLQILSDIETEGQERYNEAREAILEKEETVASLLLEAATSLATIAKEFAYPEAGGGVDGDAPHVGSPKDAWAIEWKDLLGSGEDLNDWIAAIIRDFGSLHEFLQEYLWPWAGRGPDSNPNNRGYYPDDPAERGGSGGKHSTGLAYVPYDGYVASLHKGERVLSATEVNRLRNQWGGSRAALDINVNLGGDATGMTPAQFAQLAREIQRNTIRVIQRNPSLLMTAHD